MCESMLRLFRLPSEVDRKKLMFIYKILSLQSHTVTKNIFLRRYFSYITLPNNGVKGFVPDICRLLIKYNLEGLLNNYISSQRLPSKYEWKKTVKMKVNQIEQTLWRNRINDSDFSRFKVLQTSITAASIWLNTNDRN